MRQQQSASLVCALLVACGEPADDDANDGTVATSGAATDDPSTTSAETTTSVTVSTTDVTTADASTSGQPTTAGDVESSEASSTGGAIDPGPDFRLPGPHAIATSSGTAMVSCAMGYDVFAPEGIDDAPTVVLAHGFQGNRASMTGWAEHWASWGVVVVTPDLCHATIIDSDHAQNGADLLDLAGGLERGPVLYAGYSAGGLAALVAASQDPTAVALVGLDMVDSGGLGAGAAASVVAPAHDIVSEAAMCNSTANGVPVFGAIADSSIVRLIEADHCDFQSPPDNFCSLCSAENVTQTPESIQAAIRGLSTAAVLWHTGVDASGSQWWQPGSPWYDQLFEAGTLAQL